MFELTILTTLSILRVEDRSSGVMNRVRVFFTNGYQLSIVREKGIVEGIFELCAYDQDGYVDESLFDLKDQSDTVCGKCDPDKVSYYLRKLSNLPARELPNATFDDAVPASTVPSLPAAMQQLLLEHA